MTKTIQTALGTIQGHTIDGTHRFLGIPYAKTPVGSLRFRTPEPIAPWQGVFEASGYAKDPMQQNATLDFSHYSEDCLYLNIWVPEGATDSLPVVVWVPGGAYATGGSGAPAPEGPGLYDGGLLARDMNCVFVSVSYRLNMFGFLNFSEYSNRFDDHLGMKDIIEALHWVQAHIAAFGGDWGNVTLAGQSAGAGAISALLLIDEAKEFFHKAIIQSNCFGSFYTVEEEREITDQFLTFAGVAQDQPEELLALDYQALYAAAHKLDAYVLDHYFGRCTFCPVVDGRFLKDFPTLSSFEGMGKPILVGSNRDEGMFQVFSFQWTEEEISRLSRGGLWRLSETAQERLLEGYPNLPAKGEFGRMLTDLMYTFPKLRFAEHLSEQTSVYVYRYDYVTPTLRGMGLGAMHAADMLPLFELTVEPYATLYRGDEATVHEIGTRMRRYWGAFARAGDPSVSGQEPWLPYKQNDRQTMVISQSDALVKDAESEVRKHYEPFERILI